MTFQDIEELTVPQLEGLYNGFEEVNKSLDEKLGKNTKPLEGMDAITFLQEGKL